MGGKGRAGVQAGTNLPLEYQSVLISPCPPEIAVGLEKGKNKKLKILASKAMLGGWRESKFWDLLWRQ